MKTCILLAVIASFPTLALAATIYVPDNYPTIQDAIDASVNGDTIVVRPGSYVENIDFIGKAVMVTSEMGPDVTDITGNKPSNPNHASVVSFKNGEGAGSVLNGFTLQGGVATLEGSYRYGGGIYCFASSPTITNNNIKNNCWNTPNSGGGGIACRSGSSPVIDNCFIDFNYSFGGCGAGIHCHDHSSPSITRCTFTRNREQTYHGGGIYCGLNSNPLIDSNIILNNSSAGSSRGGGIYVEDSSPIISNNAISDNYGGYGGAICCQGGSATYPARPVICNNIIAYNSSNYGGGISTRSIYADPVITNNTINGNVSNYYGGAIHCMISSAPVITNTICWNNSPDQVYVSTSASPVITYSDIKGGWTGTGNIDADPLFVSAGDFHLTLPSPCKDTGDNAAASIPSEDFEGDPRIADGTADMGADEFHPHLYYTGDVIPGGPIDVKIVGPTPAPVLLALGAGILDPPRPTPYGYLYLILPPLKTFNLGTIPSTGVRIMPATVPASWQTGDEYPLQALIGPLGNPKSVLTNLMVLTVE